jgi:glycosyltransferase involved in cell wall biosynthesis
MKLAHVVFTGGPSLFEAKKHRHANAHCFISSVNAADFEPGRDRANEIGLQRHLPAPRLGFYGVIDERLDTALLGQLATLRPDWQFVVVGPVVKIDPASLPQRANIHYFGKQEYASLAGFLAGWDVALLPFALNESTRFISPTKVLEYMAAEKPIVSTRIKDVDEPYAGIVEIADTAEQFVAACERALAESAEARDARIAKMRQVVASTSWDETVSRMRELLAAAVKSAEPTEVARALLQGEQASATSLIAPACDDDHDRARHNGLWERTNP